MSDAKLRLPEEVASYKQTALFTEATVPQGLLNDHATKAGVWGVIHVTEGQLRYVVPDRNINSVLTPELKGVIQPTEVHRVEPIGQVSFYVEFFR